MKTKHPVHIMVFGVVTCDGYIIPQFIFLHGLRLIMEAKSKCLEKVDLAEIKRVAPGKLYVKHQDYVSCHTDRKIYSWLLVHINNYITSNIWPPNLTNCYFLEYYVWGAVELETNKTFFNTKEEPKAKIMAEFTNLNKETIGKAGRRFRCRLENVVEANGNFFE